MVGLRLIELGISHTEKTLLLNWRKEGESSSGVSRRDLLLRRLRQEDEKFKSNLGNLKPVRINRLKSPGNTSQ